jgi:hypothetical protein
VEGSAASQPITDERAGQGAVGLHKQLEGSVRWRGRASSLHSPLRMQNWDFGLSTSNGADSCRHRQNWIRLCQAELRIRESRRGIKAVNSIRTKSLGQLCRGKCQQGNRSAGGTVTLNLVRSGAGKVHVESPVAAHGVVPAIEMIATGNARNRVGRAGLSGLMRED